MDSKKYYSNAVSEETPSYFKCNYVGIKKSPHHGSGKRIFPHSVAENILNQNPKRMNRSEIRPQLKIDQDLDSLKLSVHSDITKGYRDAIRYNSNHYKTFFEKIENQGFRRLTTEITSLTEMPKITRTFKVESIKRIKPILFRTEKNKLSQGYSQNELSLLFDPKPVKPKKKQPLKVDMPVLDELDIFEKKLRDQNFSKSKIAYQLYQTKSMLNK